MVEKKKTPEEEDFSDIHSLVDEIDDEGEEIEEAAYDYAKYYEDVILTHSDFEQTPLSELVPQDVLDSFEVEADKFEQIEDDIGKYERSLTELIPDELDGIVFPEALEGEVEGEEVHRIPGGIIGRLFTVRKKDWRNKIWIVTPGGAKCEDETKEMPDKMIDSIASSKGYVVLSGSDFSVVTQTKPEERKLIEDWRDSKSDEKKRKEDVVDLSGLDENLLDALEKARQMKVTVDKHYIKTLVENMVRYGHERMPEHNPEAFMTLGLAFMSCVIDGRVIIRDGWKDEIYPNLFTVIIGPPSTQKSSSYNTIRGTARLAIPNITYHVDWTKEALGAEFQHNPSAMIYKDEFAQILDPNIREGYMRGVLEFLTVIYDENEYSTHRIEESRNVDIRGVNASFTGTIQTERFYKLVTEDDVNSGFFNRFCYIILQDRKEPPKQTRYTEAIDTHKRMISHAFREIKNSLKHIDREYPVLLDYTDEGIEILNEWYAELDLHARSYGGIRAMSLVAVISRIYTMAKKASIIYEVLDRVSQEEKLFRDENNEMPVYKVSVENIKKGISFANMCFKNAEYLYLRLRSTDVAVKLEKFMDIIKSPRPGSILIKGDRGSPNALYSMSRSNLIKNSGMKLKEFEDYLSTFMAMEKLFVCNIKTSSKSKRSGEFICTFDPSDIQGDVATIEKKVREYYRKYKDRKQK